MPFPPFPTQFTQILPSANDGVHERLAKLEVRALALEGSPAFGITAAGLIPFQGIVFDPPLGYTPQPALGYTPENVANKSNDGTLVLNSATLYPTQFAVKTYVDAAIIGVGGPFLPLAGGTMVGNILFTDNSFDIGATGATRPRAIYAGTQIQIQRSAFDGTPTDGLTLINSTAAALGVQQFSSAIRLTGQGFASTPATSQAGDWRIYAAPAQGTTNSTVQLMFDTSINGAAFTNRMTFFSSGEAVFAGSVYTANASPGGFILSGKAILSSPSVGIMSLTNSAGTDFTRLNFGGITSAFPAIARSGTQLNFVLGDGTGASTISAGGLTLSGQITHPYVAKVATYTLTALDYTVDCTSGTFTINLPTAVGITGRVYVIKNSGVGVITVDPAGAELLDGLATNNLVQGEAYMIQSNGAGWIII